MKKFPVVRQMDSVDCGPASLKMVAEFYGKSYSLDELREKMHITRLGVSLLGVSEAAESIGLRATGVRITFEAFQQEAPLPCIIHWKQNHFVVVYKITKHKVCVSDPAYGLIKYPLEQFLKGFLNDGDTGLAMFLTPSPYFYEMKGSSHSASEWYFLFSYLKSYKRYFIQLFLGMLASSAILVITPFLNQALVDYGINKQDLNFVYIIFLSQLMLFLGSSFIQIIRSWILLHLGTRINISIISDFLMKMLKLPMSFFNSKMIGDILERIQDQHRIKQLLTASTLNTLFSFLNIIILGVVMLVYNRFVFTIFFIGSFISTVWIICFLRKRKELDFKMFNQQVLNRGKLIHLIQGIQEIKNSNSDTQKRWEWEAIQAKLFKVNVKSMSLAQFQEIGASLITQLKNILISIITAKAVIDGQITLGAMMAIAFIIGQLNNPLSQILNFLLVFQDAKIGLERINEIRVKDEEDASNTIRLFDIPDNNDIYLKNVSFSYESSESNFVLNDLNLTIPAGKITAIVGPSGSGKTTLMKLLLKYFPPVKGDIFLGQNSLEIIHAGKWRQRCGVVLQDGYIFSDTIAKNIGLGYLDIDYEKVEKALKIACLDSFVKESLPLGYMTRIGEEGLSLSQGQIQRLLLARAVYKDPAYIFLDEATSSLDANNEKAIMQNLTDFFRNKTVLIIAHRLSTVKNADQIVVFGNGGIMEQGRHNDLVAQKGYYYNLIKNQLELGA